MQTQEIISLLPKRISEQLTKIDLNDLCEIHLLSDRPMTLTISEKCIPFGERLSREEMQETVERLCQGSLHSYEECIKEGYIPLGDGFRAGVCGILSGGGVQEITSIRIRIPRNVYGIGNSLVKRIITENSGMLIYSPPGVGKTTLIRDIAATISSPPYMKRVSVIDSRNEIYRRDAFLRSSCDFYHGYPKAKGIELAVRTMSAQYIICDELGRNEAQMLLDTQSFGVPTIATAHAPSLEALLSRRIFAQLDSAGVFSVYVGISREGRGFSIKLDERRDKI